MRVENLSSIINWQDLSIYYRMRVENLSSIINWQDLSIYYRMRVENLSSIINWQDLKDIMRRHGEVTFAEAHKVQRLKGFLLWKSHRNILFHHNFLKPVLGNWLKCH